MKPITGEWLKAAADDLDVIQRLVSVPHLTHVVAFHAQQCIEKSLKAVAEETGVDVPKTHNLIRLLQLVNDLFPIDYDPVVMDKLDKLYIDARYPGDFGLLPDGKPSVREGELFFQTAKALKEDVERRLA